MNVNEEQVRRVVAEVLRSCLSAEPAGGTASAEGLEVPAEASGRHVHLCKADVERLFGKGYELTRKQDISQPGQYLCEERVNLVGPKGMFQNVAVLGPIRKATQVEISLTDARALGVKAPVALSGDLSRAADILIIAGENSINAEKSCIVAEKHVHMSAAEAAHAGLKDGDRVDVVMKTDRPLTFNNVIVRAGDGHSLAMHIDFDEANACGLGKGGRALICKKGQAVCAQPAVSSCSTACLPKKKFLTERDVKGLLTSDVRCLTLPKGTILSAPAKDLLSQTHIEVKFE